MDEHGLPKEKHLCMEFASYGNLAALSLFTKPYEEPSAYVVMRQLATNLRDIHRERVLHMDVKEHNILVMFAYENQMKKDCADLPLAFKFADFGVSIDLDRDTRTPEQIVYRRGTPRYMAPEQGFQSSQIHDIFRVEVYSLGLILFRLIFKQYPFSPSSYEDPAARDPNFVEAFIDSKQNTYNVRISDELKTLLKGMLQFRN